MTNLTGSLVSRFLLDCEGGSYVITSKGNPQIKKAKTLLRRSGRDKEGLFLVEGVRLTEEAVSSGLVEVAFYSPKLLESPRGEELLGKVQAAGIQAVACSASVLAEISDTVTSQGVVAVVRKPTWKWELSGLIIVADQIRDPGNLGTLFRTAVAAGAKGMLLTTGCVDPYNNKVVRASMGGIFHLPHAIFGGGQVVKMLQEAGFQIVVADLTDSETYFAAHYAQDVALVIGNEAHGPSSELRQAADVRVKIPLLGEMESLNASVAAGILMYEIVRQHHLSREDLL